MPQLDYSIYQDVGVEGGLPNGRKNCHIAGTQGELVNEDTVSLPYGRFVKAGTAGGVVPLDNTADVLVGITVFNEQQEKGPISGAVNGQVQAGIPSNKPVALLEEGEIYMIAEQAVTPSNSVFVRFGGTLTGFNAIGRVRADDDTATAKAEPRAKFRSSAAAGGLVIVYFNVHSTP